MEENDYEQLKTQIKEYHKQQVKNNERVEELSSQLHQASDTYSSKFLQLGKKLETHKKELKEHLHGL